MDGLRQLLMPGTAPRAGRKVAQDERRGLSPSPQSPYRSTGQALSCERERGYCLAALGGAGFVVA